MQNYTMWHISANFGVNMPKNKAKWNFYYLIKERSKISDKRLLFRF